ncbi:MAG: RsmB/NOP family class I SAM-dependent RNA methyltransferase [Candidatus Woesearchaeota archaeon]
MELKQVHGRENFQFKEKFEARYKALLGPRYDEFVNYSFSYLRKCIRVNTLKIAVPELVSRLRKDWNLEQVPWCKEGYWIIGERTDIGNLVEHTLGYIYVQESASMIPPVVLDPQPGETVLDMCSAPGSKASQMAQYMENKGILLCNDVIGKRIAPLGINLQRCGVSNAVITLMEGWRFSGFAFDRILVDAPCSGTGTIRKSLRTVTDWNPNAIHMMSNQQKKLLATAFNNLKDGGLIVYSTCTLEPEENEGVVSWLLEKFPNAKLEEIKLDIKRSPAVLEFEGVTFNPEVSKCLRIYPMDNNTEGFFVAKIRKE